MIGCFVATPSLTAQEGMRKEGKRLTRATVLSLAFTFKGMRVQHVTEILFTLFGNVAPSSSAPSSTLNICLLDPSLEGLRLHTSVFHSRSVTVNVLLFGNVAVTFTSFLPSPHSFVSFRTIN